MLRRVSRKLKTVIHQSVVDGLYVFDLKKEAGRIPSPLKGFSRRLQAGDADLLEQNFGPEKTKEFLNRLSSSYGFASIDQGSVMGYTWLTFERRPKEGEKPFFYKIQPKPGQSYLFDTFVLPQYRRQGVATSVIVDALNFAIGAGKSSCLTIHEESNAAIIEVSESIGFKKRGVISYRRWGPWVTKNIDALSSI